MAKRDVTLSRNDWGVVYTALSGGPNAGTVADQARRLHLWRYLTDRMQADDDPLAVALTQRQRRILIAVMDSPTNNWRLDATPRIWSIKEAFGWQRPDLTEFDEDEDADD